MISESINTKPNLEKDIGQPRWPKPDAEKHVLTSVYQKIPEKMVRVY